MLDGPPGEKLARGLYAALATGDRDALDGLLHPRFRGETTGGLPLGLGGTYESPEAMVRDFWWAIGRHYRARVEPERFLALSDGDLLVLGRYTGSAREGEGELDAAFAHVLSFAEGRIVGLRQYTDSARWAGALGDGRPRTVELTTDDAGIATVVLNRPDARNAIDLALVEDLYEAVSQVGDDPSVRAILLRGTGTVFTPGGDLAMLGGLARGELPAVLRRMVDHYHLALQRLAAFEVPVVCAVRGAAAGGGLGLVHVSDLVVAAEDARIAVGYGAIGLASDGLNAWYLPRVVGLRRAQQLYLLNRPLTGREALDWGLVSEVVPDAEVEDRAQTLVAELAAGPTRAFGGMKRLLRVSADSDLASLARAEVEEMVAAGGTDDATEGLAAFRDRRDPAFHGR